MNKVFKIAAAIVSVVLLIYSVLAWLSLSTYAGDAYYFHRISSTLYMFTIWAVFIAGVIVTQDNKVSANESKLTTNIDSERDAA